MNLRKIFFSFLVLIVLFCSFILFKTLTFKSLQRNYQKVASVTVPESAIRRFQDALAFRTISYSDPLLLDTTAFSGFLRYVATAFPLVDSLLEKRILGGYTLLYQWSGQSDSSPALIYSHYDVVPVDSASLTKWEAPPFSGDILDGYIYGRGALDDKVGVLATLEAMELLLSKGFRPARTLYFGFGHDEEVGGNNGAGLIVSYLKKNGVKLKFSLDEGAPLMDGKLVGITRPVALIGTAEKGYVSYKLTINTLGGHSSTPTEDNTIGSLAKAIVQLEQNQFDYLIAPVAEQLRYLGPEMPFFRRMVFANLWMTESMILKQLNAHTTTAPTMIEGGIKDNVIPTTASVVINFRIMPGQSIQEVYDHVLEVVNDPRIQITPLPSGGYEASPVSSANTEAFELLEKTVKQVFGDVVVSPFLLPAGTDSKYFVTISESSYRMNPAKISGISAAGFHGLNERISVESYLSSVQFYHQLIVNIE
tara:strand:- start:109938 stop:111371 length:1434 start_codon:yes stop_codon:yes gene_type:complete